ncbi:hypothetical protein [Anaerosporobacter sp.]
MNIDDSMIKSYLMGKDDSKYHWLFSSILDSGEYIFESPNSEYRENVRELYIRMYEALMDFTPYNVELFSTLFHSWKDLINDVNIILSVGCPAPYDAMVREHDGREYIIFDLIRFLSYGKTGDDLLPMIIRLITHEITHICIHVDYPVATDTYEKN